MAGRRDKGLEWPAQRADAAQRQLAIEIVAGAVQPDPFRMHGAIVAALERYPSQHALANVFTPALHIAATAHGPAIRTTIAQAIRAHVALADSNNRPHA